MFRSKFGKVVSSTFQAPGWARNAHVQTIWPRYLIKKPELNIQNERISTPDGDFLDIAWCLPDNVLAQSAKGVVVVFHGLEGSVNSHYARHLINRIKEDGFIVALMHFRGCSHESNMTPRAYHSGETVDPIQTISHVKLCAAVAVSAPLLLAECALRMQRGFSRLYQHYLLNSMKNKLLEKMQCLDIRRALSIDAGKVKALSTFREFDQDVTAKLHGFEDADEYYDHCSAMPMLKNITTNTLVLHSRDDPFMTEAVVPSENQLSNSVAYELSEKGGHVGFLHGTPFRPKLWLQERISEFLEEQHQRILAAETIKKTEINA
jgi:predicted alpha/beta-fold hydrolase